MLGRSGFGSLKHVRLGGGVWGGFGEAEQPARPAGDGSAKFEVWVVSSRED